MKEKLTVSHLNALLLSIILAGGGFIFKRGLDKFDTLSLNLINATERVSVLENTTKFIQKDIIKLEAKNER